MVFQAQPYVVPALFSVVQEDQMQGCADQHIGQETEPVGCGGMGAAHEVQAVPDLIVFPVGLSHPEPEGSDLFFTQAQLMVQPEIIGHPAAVTGFLQPPAKVPVRQIQEKPLVPETHSLQCAVAAQQGGGDGAGNGEAVPAGGPVVLRENGAKTAGVLPGGLQRPETAEKAFDMAFPDPGILVKEDHELLIGPAEAGVGQDTVECLADTQILAEVEVAGIGDMFKETLRSG